MELLQTADQMIVKSVCVLAVCSHAINSPPNALLTLILNPPVRIVKLGIVVGTVKFVVMVTMATLKYVMLDFHWVVVLRHCSKFSANFIFLQEGVS